VTRGQVDNEDNNQSQDSNILNNIHGGSLIYEVREQSIIALCIIHGAA